MVPPRKTCHTYDSEKNWQVQGIVVAIVKRTLVDVGCDFLRADPEIGICMQREIAFLREKFPGVNNEGKSQLL